jgi:hypothetical protein
MTYLQFLQAALRQTKLDYAARVKHLTEVSHLDFAIYKAQEQAKRKTATARHKADIRREINHRYYESKGRKKRGCRSRPTTNQRLKLQRQHINKILAQIPLDATNMSRDYIEYLLFLDFNHGSNYHPRGNVNETLDQDRAELRRLIEVYCPQYKESEA